MARAHVTFCHQFRVRYAEVDAQGIVNNARYLDYADLVLTEFLRERLGNPNHFEIHVVRAEIDYVRPIRNDELVDGLMRIERFGRSSMTSRIELHGAGHEDLRAAISLAHVYVDAVGGSPIRIPDHLRVQLG